jgi:hypothetical protein
MNRSCDRPWINMEEKQGEENKRKCTKEEQVQLLETEGKLKNEQNGKENKWKRD